MPPLSPAGLQHDASSQKLVLADTMTQPEEPRGWPRVIKTCLWSGILLVVAARPWYGVSFDHVPVVQWIGVVLCLLWYGVQRLSGRHLPRWWVGSCVLLLLAFLLGSRESHDAQARFFEGHALVFGMMVCASVIVSTAAQQRDVLFVCVITGTLLGLHALWQRCILFPALQQFPWGRLVAERGLTGIPDHTLEYATQVIQRGRVFGPFPLPAILAAAMGMFLPLSVLGLRLGVAGPVRRIGRTGMAAIQSVALVLTQSLGGVASLCAATCLALSRARSSWRTKRLVVGLTVVIIAGIAALRPELLDLSHDRNPITQRWRYWGSTVRMIADHPLRGIGAGNYPEFYARYRHPRGTDTRFAHNALLQVWAEWGVVGALGLLGLLIGSLHAATRRPLECQIALYVFWMMATIDVIWFLPQVAYLGWLVIGLVVAAEAVEAGDATVAAPVRSTTDDVNA